MDGEGQKCHVAQYKACMMRLLVVVDVMNALKLCKSVCMKICKVEIVSLGNS